MNWVSKTESYRELIEGFRNLFREWYQTDNQGVTNCEYENATIINLSRTL